MNRVLGLLMLVLLLAACAGMHRVANPVVSVPPLPTPTVDTGLLRDYAMTADSAAPDVATIIKALRGCGRSARRCEVDAAASRTVAAHLLHQMNAEDSYRESAPNGSLPPGISPLLVRTEGDATTVESAARAVESHSGKLAIQRLTGSLNRLAADVDAWQPNGRAGQVLATVHVTVPSVPVANMPAK